ncbi:hypothetical protein ACFO5R_18745 [Halosolutus amylolyticus]|uniref:Beta-ketoadipyl CoA thiolase n=1 Tax=Halosolutus amylolyticus TaxID=2932267 RepID=A0ABD5PTQ4_9EURY
MWYRYAVSTELIVFGAVAILLGVGLLSAARRFYPRLELAEDALSTIRLLTALIAAVLLLTGVGLVLVGLFG